MEVGLLHIANKRFKDLIPLLKKYFDMDANNHWEIRKGSSLGQHIPKDKKIEYFLRSILFRKNKIKFDDLIAEIMPNLVNGSVSTEDEILKVLKRIGITNKDNTWSLSKQSSSSQMDLGLSITKERKSDIVPVELNKEANLHNRIIYRLAASGIDKGHDIYIGKQERTDNVLVDSLKENNIDYLTRLPFKKMTPSQKRRIEQIDCIYCHKSGVPLWAFEVEKSTGIKDALQRFKDLLEVNSEIGSRRQLIIIAPLSRRSKLLQELKTSTYIGHPLYFDNKVRFMYIEELEKTLDKKGDWKSLLRNINL